MIGFIVDDFRKSFMYKNIGLLAQCLVDQGFRVCFVTNETKANRECGELGKKIELTKLKCRGNSLDRVSLFRWLVRHGRSMAGVYLYRSRQYAFMVGILARLLGSKVMVKLDSWGEPTGIACRIGRHRILRRLFNLREQGRSEFELLRGTLGTFLNSDCLMKLADIILCESPEVFEMTHVYNVDSKLVLYPNAVPRRVFERSKNLLRLPKENIVLAVGRIYGAKRFDMVIKAFETVPPVVRTNWRLVIIGPSEDDEYKDSLIRLCKELGLQESVTLNDEMYGDKLYEWYAKARIFVIYHPREFEGGRLRGQPNVIVEAMCFGCAVISSDVGTAGYLLDYGRLGKLIPADDVGCLSETMAGMMVSPGRAEGLGRDARAYVERHLLLDDKVRDIAERLQGGRRG